MPKFSTWKKEKEFVNDTSCRKKRNFGKSFELAIYAVAAFDHITIYSQCFCLCKPIQARAE